jgi:hypothetical protein
MGRTTDILPMVPAEMGKRTTTTAKVRYSADEAKADPNYVSNHTDYDYDTESRLHCNRATMAIDNRYIYKSSAEQRTFKQREIAV